MKEAVKGKRQRRLKITRKEGRTPSSFCCFWQAFSSLPCNWRELRVSDYIVGEAVFPGRTHLEWAEPPFYLWSVSVPHDTYGAQDGFVFKGGTEARNYELSELLGIQLLPRGNEGERCECISGKYITVANALVCILFPWWTWKDITSVPPPQAIISDWAKQLIFLQLRLLNINF